MGVKNVIRKIGDKAGNTVARLAALSSDQVEAVQLQREQYLLEMPDPNDPAARALTDRMMAATSVEVFNAYLTQLKNLYLPVEKDAEYETTFDPNFNIRFVNITKWVTDKKENSLEKLVNVYAVLANEDCNIALVFHRTQKRTNVYLAIVNTANADNNVRADIFKDRILDAIRGNFPGAEWKDEGTGILPCLKNDRAYSVATASNIPAEKSEKFISQTIEKLLDGIVPDSRKKEYILILLATPIQDVEERKLKLGEFYSGMAPYASWQQDYHLQENESVGSTATIGVNVGASAGVQNGANTAIAESGSETHNQAQTLTENKSQTNTSGVTDTLSSSSSETSGTTENRTVTKGTNQSSGTSNTHTEGTHSSVGVTVGPKVASVNVSAGQNEATATGTSTQTGISNSVAEALGKTASETLTRGVSNAVSNSVAQTTGTAVANTLGRAVTKGMATTSGLSKAVNFGANFGANFARSSTITAMIGKSEGITQTFTNYNIKHALELIETQMKRLKQSTALGMWDFAAYVLSEDMNTANNVAHSYLALTLGEESYMAKSAINLWKGNVEEERAAAAMICSYLRELRHPIFGLNPRALSVDRAYNVYPSIVTATTSLSGKELAYSLNFPQRAVSGLPILECAEFGRNIVTYDYADHNVGEIMLGRIFHMNHPEENEVRLSKQSLTSHAFITGSTGSGKSNTVYRMLKEARANGVKFLVIEPAKGEYKHIFGMRKDVSVYGTNPELTPMLRINPFSFPKGIHILEHLDRLIEIFNVCWPMYAAMPAVLKTAVEQAYKDCGWNLNTSRNAYGEDIYPAFADVARKIKDVIDSSEYDNDNKGAYKGALQTRLASLANGLNGMIFVQDEISAEKLFEENVIIDLSRVGSSETKSLIMGMLVLKLQEHRMVSADRMNSELKHLTVLEEAHNLLKRATTAQSAEGANLMSKSVEMLANAIAEMRTYGEGFIIADQAPGLLDMSVIRNTNTKIIMRLPDLGDRELVGRSAGLNDDQITELAKLPCGVAAVYQNEWVQPVLCKVKKYDERTKPYEYTISPVDAARYEDKQIISESLLDFIMNRELPRKSQEEAVQSLKVRIISSRLDCRVKCDFLEYISSKEPEAVDALRSLLYDFLGAEKAIRNAQECVNITDWVHTVVRGLSPSIQSYSSQQIDLVLGLLLCEQSLRDNAYDELLSAFTEIYKYEGGVF